MKEPSYCGCCGRRCRSEWCARCERHVDPKKTFWDATYLAQHGVDCPYAIATTEQTNGARITKVETVA